MSRFTKEVSPVSFEEMLKPVPPAAVRNRIPRTQEQIAAAKEEAVKEGLEQGRQSGYLEGLTVGRQEGREEGAREAYEVAQGEKQKEIDDFRDCCQTLLAQMHRAMQEWFISGEGQLAQLAAVIAARVVARELTTDPESILAITKEAIAEVTHATYACIKANPFDSALLREHKDEIIAASQSVRDLEIVEDPAILGGCVIETEGGIVEATMDMKLREALDSIRRAA